MMNVLLLQMNYFQKKWFILTNIKKYFILAFIDI